MSIALQSGKHFLFTNANSALGFARMIISTYALSVAGRGLLTTIYILPNVVQMLGELGVSVAAVYFIGKKKYTEQEVTSTVFWSMFGLGLLYAVGMYLFSYLNPDMDPQGITETQKLCVLGQIPFSMAMTALTPLFVYRRWLNRHFALQIIKTLANILILVQIGFVMYPGGVPAEMIDAMVIFHLIASIGFAAVTYYMIRDWMGAVPSFRIFRTLLSFGWAQTLTTSAMFLLNYGDQYYLSRLIKDNNVTVGIYTIAFGFATVIMQFGRSISQISVRTSAEASIEESDRMAVEVGRRSMLISTGFALIGAITMPPAVWLLLPRDYELAIVPFEILILSTPFYALSLILGNIPFSRGRMFIGALPPILAFFTNLGLNLWWIPIWGMHGAAWATVVAFMVLLAARLATLALFTNTRMALAALMVQRSDFVFMRDKARQVFAAVMKKRRA